SRFRIRQMNSTSGPDPLIAKIEPILARAMYRSRGADSGPRPSRRLLAQAPQDEEKKLFMTQLAATRRAGEGQQDAAQAFRLRTGFHIHGRPRRMDVFCQPDLGPRFWQYHAIPVLVRSGILRTRDCHRL